MVYSDKFKAEGFRINKLRIVNNNNNNNNVTEVFKHCAMMQKLVRSNQKTVACFQS